jgi:hypothetical protein
MLGGGRQRAKHQRGRVAELGEAAAAFPFAGLVVGLIGALVYFVAMEIGLSGLLAALLGALAPARLVEPKAMALGGLFMGVNFLLLCYGVAWIITPLAGRGKVKAGVALLALKVMLFLALLSVVFFKLDLDAVSFTLGFSTLLVAIVIEAARKENYAGT